MAKIVTRIWTSRGPTGKRVRHVAYGFDHRVNGQRERRFSAEWLAENDALAALVERQREIAAGRIDRPADRTLAELADEYLAYKEQHGKRSLREGRRIVKTRLLPALESDQPVRRLTAPAIAQYEKQRTAAVSAFTVANELGVLRHMLRLGKRWGYLDSVPDIELPKKPQGRTRFLDENEIAKLLDGGVQSHNPYLLAIVTVALNTGMRKAEILGLERERVDLSTGRLTLYRTKSGKPRGVPINRAVYDALVALEPDANRRNGRVFAGRHGAAWGQIRTAFASALRRAGIEGFRFHDLRHTAASHLVMRDASLKDVQELLGHADLKMTQRYAHLSPAHLRGAVDRLDGLTPATRSHEWAQSGKLSGATKAESVASARNTSGAP
jgi:integrase